MQRLFYKMCKLANFNSHCVYLFALVCVTREINARAMSENVGNSTHPDEVIYNINEPTIQVQNETSNGRIENLIKYVPYESPAFNRTKRSTYNNEVKLNNLERYVELVLVVDSGLFTELGRSMVRVKQHCKALVNIVNSVYSQLNIYVALVGVKVWTNRDEIDYGAADDDFVNNFLQYRYSHLLPEIPHDHAQLLTTRQFSDGVIGKALMATMCTVSSGGVVTDDLSISLPSTAAIIIHEMGHSFGMAHDEEDCDCEDNYCIMFGSQSSRPPTRWSSCSHRYLLKWFTDGLDYCLRNKPTRIYDPPTCGNGFVERGEQCDCGIGNSSANLCLRCCHMETCTLRRNASCANGECCDQTTCQLMGASTVCRASDMECDLPEYCNGESEFCPSDVHKADAETCNNDKAYCFEGTCRTRDRQCQLLWGPSGNDSIEECYSKNRKGDNHGNCGYDESTKRHIRCSDEDSLCGLLHCHHLNNPTLFGSYVGRNQSVILISQDNKVVHCYAVIVGLASSHAEQSDLGYVQNGVKCGENKMCHNRKCIPVERLKAHRQATYSDPHCDCSGHGVCNSIGQCHCDNGFNPPFCTGPGPGGSVHSGPAKNPHTPRVVMIVFFIIFLGIIPSLIVAALIYNTFIKNKMYTNPWKQCTFNVTWDINLKMHFSSFTSKFHNWPNNATSNGKTEIERGRNIEIGDASLAFTTNENVGDRMKHYSIRQSGLYKSGTDDKIMNFNCA